MSRHLKASYQKGANKSTNLVRNGIKTAACRTYRETCHATLSTDRVRHLGWRKVAQDKHCLHVHCLHVNTSGAHEVSVLRTSEVGGATVGQHVVPTVMVDMQSKHHQQSQSVIATATRCSLVVTVVTAMDNRHGLHFPCLVGS